jgi:predicted permease
VTRPPLLPALLLRLLLPRHLHEAIAGDLEEAWHADRRRARYWSIALRSIADCWRDRLQRPRADPHSNRGDNPMRSVLQDARYGCRMMLRNPGFTLAAVITLALGIGANTAIFSLLNVLTIKPLPYHDADRVVFLLGTDAESGAIRFSLQVADYFDIRREAQSFERLAAYSYLSANITGGDIPERVQAYMVTPETFELLGTAPALGRVFSSADGTAGRNQVAVISNGLWKRRFGADPSVIGRTVLLNGRPHDIVGVMPARFEYPVFNFKGDLWVPWILDSNAATTNRAGSGSTTVVARLRPGIAERQADIELKTIMRRLAAAHPATNATLSARVIQMGRLDDEQAGPGLLIVMATVAVVLLLACANVANLLLARGLSRSRELAVRAAVGASRWRITRQLIVESFLLALAGAAGGVLLARVAIDAIRGVLPEMILTTVPNVNDLGVDGTTLLFTLLVSIAASLVFGLVPAWRAARPQLQDGLKEGAATGGSLGTRRLRTTLVVVEVALATLLAVTAGLLGRSYGELRKLSPGFKPDGILTMAMTLPSDRYPDGPQRLQFFEAAAASISVLPGVRSAAFVNVLPFSTYDRSTTLSIEGSPPPEPKRQPRASFRVASAGYFSTMEIPLLSGRVFDARDRDGTAPVAIVNHTFVKRHLGNSEAVGRRIRLGDRDSAGQWTTIVGVVGDVNHWQLTQAPDPEVYLPLRQAPVAMMMLAVRTDNRPEDLVAAVRGRILEIDRLQPVYHVKPMSRLVGDALLAQTTSAALMAIFSGLALVLALVGVYGVVSYGVRQQMGEFGLRLALGATRSSLLALVLRRGALMIIGGIAIGVTGALAASGVLRTLLYGVAPMDPLTYATAAAALLAMGLGACIVPAWRAASASALAAIRSE